MYLFLPPDERRIGADELRTYTSTFVKTWIGGYRNRPEAWAEPRNWFPAGIPAERDRVTVGGYSKHRCIVHTGTDPIASLTILPGATLIIAKSGLLTVDGTYTDTLGLLGASGVYIGGCLHVQGEFAIRNATSGGITNSGFLINRGRLCVDHSVTECAKAWGNITALGDLERTQ